MKLGDIALQIGETTTKVVDIATRLIRVMVADEEIRVELLGCLILECSRNGCIGEIPREIVPAGLE